MADGLLVSTMLPANNTHLIRLGAQVANAVFAFPLAKYAQNGHDLVVGGNLELVLAGDAWGQCRRLCA